MGAAENLATVKGIYQAFGTGDVPAILDQLADDVDWAADAADASIAPWFGERHGKDEVVGFFEALGGAVDVLDFEPVAFTAGDNEVMVLLTFTMRSKQTGREASMNLHHYWRFSDGKVDRYRGSEDTAQTAAMLA